MRDMIIIAVVVAVMHVAADAFASAIGLGDFEPQPFLAFVAALLGAWGYRRLGEPK